jgi:type I restriction enzyme, S subunit
MENVTSKNNLDKYELRLPSSWVKCSLEAVCEILDSRRIPINANERADRTSGKSRKELFPYFGATGQVGYIDDYIFEGEYVLLGEDGAPFLDSFKDKAYIASGKFWVNNHAHILRSKVSNKFLCHYLNQFNYAKYVTGTTRLKLNQSSLLNIPIVFPPENEQHRIVAKIEELFSELDKGVESLKVAREQLKVYRQALLKHAFEGKLTEQWRKAHADQLETADQLLERIKQERERRYQQQVADWEAADKKGSKPKAPKTSQPMTAKKLAELPELPMGWGWVRVADLCDVVRGGSPRPAGDPKFYGGNIPFLKVADITNNTSPYLQQFTYTITQAGLSKTRQIKPKTLLLSNSGATLGVPKICLISATLNDGVAAFLDLREDVLLYHYYFWQSKTRELRAINQGAAQPNLNTDLIKEVLMPICSQAEKIFLIQQIESNLSAVDQLDHTITALLQQSEALRQSILKKAFSGQLVPQHPDDKPASILLESIRAEREATAKPTHERVKNKKKEKISSMADLIQVLESANTWLSARDVFRQCGIGDGAETDIIEKLYFELRNYISEERLEVERRGDEDWLRIRPTKEK